jgi:hypothetical protein
MQFRAIVAGHGMRYRYVEISERSGKLDTLTIMKITGHKTESQFLSYIKITPREYAERLKELWRKL